jgi:hypothetical protein
MVYPGRRILVRAAHFAAKFCKFYNPVNPDSDNDYPKGWGIKDSFPFLRSINQLNIVYSGE